MLSEAKAELGRSWVRGCAAGWARLLGDFGSSPRCGRSASVLGVVACQPLLLPARLVENRIPGSAHLLDDIPVLVLAVVDRPDQVHLPISKAHRVTVKQHP